MYYSEIVEFVRSLYPKTDIVPLHSPCFIGNERKYVNDCIESTFVSSVGKFVDRFECMIEEYTGATKAVACVNGTSALHLALKLVGVQQNDEVITQALTFVATCNAISYNGAYPVFIDVDTDTLGLSPTSLRIWLARNSVIRNGNCYNIKSGRRIMACVPMHTFGHPVKIDEIEVICKEYHIELVEDAAESIGSFFKGKHTGTFGKIGVLSFNGNKTITTGGGGMMLFKDIELGRYAKHLTTQAKVKHEWEFIHDQIGFNYRMPNINAALGCAQMEQISFIIENKRLLSRAYQKFFEKINGIDFFLEPKFSCSNYWLNTIMFSDISYKQEFLEFSNKHGIQTPPAWRLMNYLEMFGNCENDGLQNSIQIASSIVNLPSSVLIDNSKSNGKF